MHRDSPLPREIAREHELSFLVGKECEIYGFNVAVDAWKAIPLEAMHRDGLVLNWSATLRVDNSNLHSPRLLQFGKRP